MTVSVLKTIISLIECRLCDHTDARVFAIIIQIFEEKEN